MYDISVGPGRSLGGCASSRQDHSLETSPGKAAPAVDLITTFQTGSRFVYFRFVLVA